MSVSPVSREKSCCASALIFGLSVKGDTSFAESTFASWQSFIWRPLSSFARASRDFMMFEHCWQSVLKARSKAMAGAAWRIFWNFCTR